jgi:hypothetical protein
MYAFTVIGAVLVFDRMMLDTATVPEETELITVEPDVLTFFTPYDTFVYVAMCYPIINAK